MNNETNKKPTVAEVIAAQPEALPIAQPIVADAQPQPQEVPQAQPPLEVVPPVPTPEPALDPAFNYLKPDEVNFRDSKPPKFLTITIADQDGNVFDEIVAPAKVFSSGSVGFYGNGKVKNKLNPIARYQVGINIALINSKAKKTTKKK